MFLELALELVVDSIALQIEFGHGINMEHFWERFMTHPFTNTICEFLSTVVALPQHSSTTWLTQHNLLLLVPDRFLVAVCICAQRVDLGLCHDSDSDLLQKH